MNLKPLMIIPPIAIGVLGFIWMTSGSQAPVGAAQEHALAVRVVEITPQTVTATSVAYGRVEAEHSWTALAEVAGRVSAVMPGLAEGKMVRQGEVLAEIDATDYDISLRKARANLSSAEAQLAQLTKEEDNTRRSLLLEQSNLTIAEAEFERVQSLVKRGASTETALDGARRSLLGQQAAITNLTNTLALYPTRQSAAEATLAVRQAEMAEAERALAKTRIVAPFDGRVTSANIELGQFARSGDSLVVLDSIEASEITAEIQPRQLGMLVEDVFDAMQDANLPGVQDIPVTLLKTAGVEALVSYPQVEDFDPWPAEIVRFRGSRDSQTGAMGVVVRVADPTRLSADAERPPLTTGSFVAVTFRAAPREGVILMPRSVVHQDDAGNPIAYVVGAEDRLELRQVTLDGVIGADVVVTSGLVEGDRVILSDPRPPVPGLKLIPVFVPAVTPAATLAAGSAAEAQ